MENVDLLSDLIKPTGKQREFLQTVLDKDFVLYGGAAGGGKSYILRWSLVYLLTRWYFDTRIRGIRVGLFCEDYPTLKDRHLSKIKYEFPAWLGTYRETDHEFKLSPEYGEGVISFRNLDDTSKYLSSEFAVIAIDELTQNDQTVFDFLRMRLRWPGIDRPKFIAATNPGSKGHGWVKALWVDRQFPRELTEYKDRFAFVSAKLADNPYLSPSYVEDMQTLPEHLRKAYTEGSWDIFAGQVFTEWSRDKHIVTPFAIPSSWTRIRSLDWGFSKPYCVLWSAIDQDGTAWIYRELYGATGINIGSQETAAEVGKNVLNLELGEAISYGVADPACWQKTQSGTTQLYSIYDHFREAGVEWQRADNDRIAGKNEVHTRLRDGKLKVFANCVNLIRTLPALVYDDRLTKIEDVDTDQEDHAYDSLRYLLMSRRSKNKGWDSSRNRVGGRL